MSTPRLELRYVPGCPHVGAARRLLGGCLQRLGLAWEVVEVPGEFPSPVIGVDGRDVVTGEPLDALDTAACRLGLPTSDRVLAALGRAQEVRRCAD